VCFFTRARRAANPQPAQRQGCSKEQQQQQLHALLLKAESITFSPDEAAADLVDAERMLLRAIQVRASARAHARVCWGGGTHTWHPLCW
jgi:hypothetical protein